MSNIKLLFPVHSLDGELLLPAGAELTEETMSFLKASNKSNYNRTYSLLNHGSVKQDILDFLGSPPFNLIFVDHERTEVLEAMKNIKLIQPILDALDYFKQHDFYTYRHMLTVFALTILVAKDLVPDYQKRVSEITEGPTHDFGKIYVPLDILQKVQPLNKNELETLRHHTITGFTLLSYYLGDHKSLTTRVARDHHERINGSGYPRGIKQHDPIVEIIATCDVYDALISPRPYRSNSYDNRTALEVITEMAEKGEVGWDVVHALVAHSRESKPSYKHIKVSLEKRGTPPPGNSYGKLAED
jgi:HD-GYP domain-containing protein (c-di-GMP phosphodiesterase class II)